MAQYAAVSAVLLESKKATDRALMLSSTELSSLECAVKVMEPFKHATTILCVEKTPSISMVQPVLTALEKKFLSVAETDSDLSVNM